MMPVAPKRAAIYLRLSVENADERAATGQSASIDRQEKDLRILADAEGWTIAPEHIFVDDGLTGRKVRENARAALRALAAGVVDVLLVWKFDRFSRQGPRAIAGLVDALAANPNGLFVSMHDGLRSDMGPAWEMVAGNLARAAKAEAENMALRVARAHAGNRADGRFTGGTVPIGYVTAERTDRNGNRLPGRMLTPDPVVAPLLRDLAERVLAGESFLSVCRLANESGVKPPRSDRWRVSTLRTALTGDPIVGRYSYRGALVRNEDGTPRQVWEPVLDLETWRAVRARLDERAMTPTTKRSRGTRGRLLSGLAVCECGSSLHMHRNSNGTLSYRCSGPQNGVGCPTRVSVLCDRLEEYVVAQVLPALRDLPIVVETEAEPSTAELADVLEAITAASAEFAAPGADHAGLAARMAALQERRATLEAAARVARRTTVRVEGESFGELWERADDITRRKHLARALEAIVVRPRPRGPHGWPPLASDSVTIRWRGAYADDSVLLSAEAD